MKRLYKSTRLKIFKRAARISVFNASFLCCYVHKNRSKSTLSNKPSSFLQKKSNQTQHKTYIYSQYILKYCRLHLSPSNQLYLQMPHSVHSHREKHQKYLLNKLLCCEASTPGAFYCQVLPLFLLSSKTQKSKIYKYIQFP